MSYSEVKRIMGKTYVVGLFVEKRDFVGQDDWQGISKLINGSPSVNILKASYTQARGTFNQLSESDYETDKKFATSQLEEIKRSPNGNKMPVALATLKASYTRARGTFNQLSESDYETNKEFATSQLEDAGYLPGENPKVIKRSPNGNKMPVALAMLTVAGAGAYAVSRRIRSQQG